MKLDILDEQLDVIFLKIFVDKFETNKDRFISVFTSLTGRNHESAAGCCF